MKIAFCFAGQGAQYVGMGLDLYENFDIAKKIYDEFPEIRDICFYDKDNTLNQTATAQKAILLTSYVIAQILKENGIEPDYVCGLSLGEYSALAFSEVWDLKTAIDIVSKRGIIMQNALPLGTTKMAAVLGLERDIIANAIKNISGVCEIANYNCPGQIVITGDNEAIDIASKQLEELGAKRVVPLNVSGAFHSSLLIPASKELRIVLDNYIPNEPKYNVVYNFTGKEDNRPINEILEYQICHSVYFEDSLKYLKDKGVFNFIEIGPGKALSGFIRKSVKEIKLSSAADAESIKNIINDLK
ncbi:MAG: ACP S-malonyltransferase [Anaeroplasma sp.]